MRLYRVFEVEMTYSTMGQLLSLPFIILGIVAIVYSLRRPAVADVNAVVNHANKMYDKEDKKHGKRGK